MCECFDKTSKMPSPNDELVCVKDFEKFMVDRLPKSWSDFVCGGSDEEYTLRGSEAVWKRLRIRPRCLTGLSPDCVDTSVVIFGQRMDLPIFMAPTGLQSMAHEDGEVATAKACKSLGGCMLLSFGTSKPCRDVIMASEDRSVGVQIEFPRTQSGLDKLLQKIKSVGFKFIVLTVDITVLGNRYQDKRNGFTIPDHLSVPLVEDMVKDSLDERGLSDEQLRDNIQVATYLSHVKKNLSWEDVDYVVKNADLPVVIKGILTAEDAIEAVNHGAKGIIVSNHGGRQLDTALTSAEALPEIVAAVDGRIPVLIDGGIRQGSDVFKALALGATAVLVGRPIFWGLAYKGQEGVEQVFNILLEELKRTMILSGCKDLASITPKHVIHESLLWSRFASLGHHN